jgi:hypothetical protein
MAFFPAGIIAACDDVVPAVSGLTGFSAMLEQRDLSKVQDPDEGAQRAHLPSAAEVEMSEVRQDQDAEAKGEVDQAAPAAVGLLPERHEGSGFTEPRRPDGGRN